MSAFSHVGGGDVERICDVCGRRRAMRRLRVVGKYRVCERHPGWVPPETLEKRPTISLGAPEPVRDARPFDPRDTFEAIERQLFDFLVRDSALGNEEFNLNNCALGPATVLAAPIPIQAVGWQGVYLYEVINEAARPIEWVTKARTRLKAVAEYLLANQKAGPSVVSAFTDVDAEWGAYDRGSTTYAPHDSAVAGLALTRAYQVFGDSRYLAGARACAWFVRTSQCGHLMTNRPSSLDAAGAIVKYWGATPTRLQRSAGTLYSSHVFAVQGLLAAEFLTIYRSVTGDETIGSPTTNADYNASRAALVSTCISDMRAFWDLSIYSVLHATAIKGFTTTTPYSGFDSYPSNKGIFAAGQGSWFHSDGFANGTLIQVTDNWALGLRAFYVMDGASSFVTGVFDWLMACGVNSDFALPATTAGRMVSGYDDKVLLAGNKGPFDPRYAPATFHKVREAGAWVNKAGSSFYDLASTGLLAALYSSRQRPYFKALKETVAEPRSRNVLDGGRLPLTLLGRCGFSWQPYTDASLNRTASIARAAQFGLAYRFQPKAALGRGLV